MAFCKTLKGRLRLSHGSDRRQTLPKRIQMTPDVKCFNAEQKKFGEIFDLKSLCSNTKKARFWTSYSHIDFKISFRVKCFFRWTHSSASYDQKPSEKHLHKYIMIFWSRNHMIVHHMIARSYDHMIIWSNDRMITRPYDHMIIRPCSHMVIFRNHVITSYRMMSYPIAWHHISWHDITPYDLISIRWHDVISYDMIW